VVEAQVFTSKGVQAVRVAMVVVVLALPVAMLHQQQEHQIPVAAAAVVDQALHLFKLQVVVMAALV
jgi:hypothetical protein